MKFNKFLCVGTIALNFIILGADKAEAATFTFENFNPGSVGGFSASGFFEIRDGVNGEVDFSSDLIDAEIVFSGATADSSDTLTLSNFNLSRGNITGVTTDGSTLDFTNITGGALNFVRLNGGFGEDQLYIGFDSFFNQFTDQVRLDSTPSVRLSGETISYSSSLGVLTNANATSVPESSTTLGLFLIGGLFGISSYVKARKGK